jgi:hypothetical protein
VRERGRTGARLRELGRSERRAAGRERVRQHRARHAPGSGRSSTSPACRSTRTPATRA